MSIEAEQAAKLIQTNTELTDIFLKKEEAIEKELQQLRDWKAGLNIAFSANHFVWNASQETKYKTILKADNVEINTGSAYNKDTGIFTAPTNGTYAFSAKVFVSTLVVESDGTTSVDNTNIKWWDDMHFNINRYDVGVTPNGTGAGADKIGEIWIGERPPIGPDRLRANWTRSQASDSVLHYLKAGEKVCVEFQLWNGAEEGDGVMASYTFSGHRIA